MSKIQTSCPNCKQPLVAEIFQVVDITQTPQLKEILLAGGLNFAQCQICGFQGQLPIPLVYHDGEKELLLTFSPPDAAKTMEMKESALAPLLKNVIDNLDQKDRKGYLFQPQAMLTMNNLVKNVLLADGITEEMIQSQEEKMLLLDKLFTQGGDKLKNTIIENMAQIDREFFALFAEIAQRIIASRDEKSIEKVKEVQDILMAETEIGKEIMAETKELQAATESLEALGKNLSRDSLLELVINAPNNERLKALAGLVRPAMDYQFFQGFTETIESADEEHRKELIEKRNLLLKLTQEIDQQLEARVAEARDVIERIINHDSLEEGLMENIGLIDQFFVQALSVEIKSSDPKKEEQRTEKLTALLQRIQELSKTPELKIVEKLIGLSDDENKLDEMLNGLEDSITPKVIEYLTSIIGNYEENINTGDVEDKEELEETLVRLRNIYTSILKKSMKSKFNK